MTTHWNRRTRVRTAAVPVAALAAAVLGLTTACSSSSTSAGSGRSTSPPASSSSLSPSTPAPSAPAPSAPAPSASAPSAAAAGTTPSPGGDGGAPATHAVGPHDCATSQLTVAQTNPSVGAGQYFSTLVFTNTSGTACMLSGYPGVSYVAENGVQSGNAAARSPGTVTTVTLQPHGTASAVLHDTNGMGGYDPQQCQLSPAEGLRIYPPNQQAALFLPWKTQHCAGPTIHSFTIGPVQAGSSATG